MSIKSIVLIDFGALAIEIHPFVGFGDICITSKALEISSVFVGNSPQMISARKFDVKLIDSEMPSVLEKYFLHYIQ